MFTRSITLLPLIHLKILLFIINIIRDISENNI